MYSLTHKSMAAFLAEFSWQGGQTPSSLPPPKPGPNCTRLGPCPACSGHVWLHHIHAATHVPMVLCSNYPTCHVRVNLPHGTKVLGILPPGADPDGNPGKNGSHSEAA